MIEIFCNKDEVVFDYSIASSISKAIILKIINARYIVTAEFKSIYTLKDIGLNDYFMLNIEGEKILLRKTPGGTNACIYIEHQIMVSNII